MIARRDVWSNPEVKQLLKNFVVAADEVYRLQTGSDPECKLAQKVFEQGHYAGRTQPSNTRQGTYATAPSGILLASINSNDPKAMADMLRRALDKWNSLTPEQRMLADAPQQAAHVTRPEQKYPADGLVLRVFSRDLPREHKSKDWRAEAWNQDFAWFNKTEVQTMLPERLEPGQKATVPRPLVERLARFSLIDNVRGQEPSFAPSHIQEATLETEVVRKQGNVVHLRLKGKTKAHHEGEWSVAGYQDMNRPSIQKRGVELDLLGTAAYDTRAQRFTAWEVVAIGTRFGATQYNGRHDDRDPAPIGFLLTQAGTTPAEQVAPAMFSQYGW